MPTNLAIDNAFIYLNAQGHCVNHIPSSEASKPLGFKAPAIHHIISQLQECGGVQWRRVYSFTLLKLPILFGLLALFFWIGNMALWQPLRKALFSWREGLMFSYGDFAVFFLLSLALAALLIVWIWKIYRAECELLAICNFGVATESFTFDSNFIHYQFTDAAGKMHSKLFAEDYAHLYPLPKRLAKDPREALTNLSLFTADSARACAEDILSGKKRAKVYYLAEMPEICHLVIDDGMSEYFWRK